MDSLERQLVAFLLGLSELTSVVGNRLYPQILDNQKPLPAAVYHIISGMDKARTQEGHAGYRDTRLQLDLIGRDYLVLSDLHASLDARLNGKRVLLGAPGASRGATIWYAGQTDGYDPATTLRTRTVDYLIQHDTQ